MGENINIGVARKLRATSASYAHSIVRIWTRQKKMKMFEIPTTFFHWTKYTIFQKRKNKFILWMIKYCFLFTLLKGFSNFPKKLYVFILGFDLSGYVVIISKLQIKIPVPKK